jgi:hypothetical protein
MVLTGRLDQRYGVRQSTAITGADFFLKVDGARVHTGCVHRGRFNKTR